MRNSQTQSIKSILLLASSFTFAFLLGEIVYDCGHYLGHLAYGNPDHVQVGDITRTVYLAPMSLVVTTGLWVWLEEPASKLDDKKTSRGTLVINFGLKFSDCFGVLAFAILFYITIIVAAFSGSQSSH